MDSGRNDHVQPPRQRSPIPRNDRRPEARPRARRVTVTPVTIGPPPADTEELAPQPLRVRPDQDHEYRVWVFNVGLACCAVEFVAASMRDDDFTRVGARPFAASAREADLMVVSGTVTDKMAPAIKR